MAGRRGRGWRARGGDKRSTDFMKKLPGFECCGPPPLEACVFFVQYSIVQYLVGLLMSVFVYRRRWKTKWVMNGICVCVCVCLPWGLCSGCGASSIEIEVKPVMVSSRGGVLCACDGFPRCVLWSTQEICFRHRWWRRFSTPPICLFLCTVIVLCQCIW